MKHLRPVFAAMALLASLSFVPSADAQLLWRWFGPKAGDKSPPAKTSQPDPRRAAEINVEIAWLADPVTFPYYLEAHTTGAQLEVRGYVPSKAVRDHALRIAQVYTTAPVVDSMKEHPSLLVKPGQMSAPQLQSSALSSLRVALPKQHSQLKVECGSDGKVVVTGPVNSVEEKIAVSHALRRLHGCTSVQNLTMLPTDSPTPPRDKGPTVKTSMPGDKPMATQDKSKSWPSWPFGRDTGTTKEEPPLLEPGKLKPIDRKGPNTVDGKNPPKAEGPILIPNVPEVKDKPKDVVKAPTPKTPLTAAELQKRVHAAYPQAKGVEVQFVSATDVRITLDIRAESELDAAAERVFAMPELQNYRPDLQFRIGAP